MWTTTSLVLVVTKKSTLCHGWRLVQQQQRQFGLLVSTLRNQELRRRKKSMSLTGCCFAGGRVDCVGTMHCSSSSNVLENATAGPNSPLSALAKSISRQVHDLWLQHYGNTTTTTTKHVNENQVNIQLVVSVSGGCDSMALLHACMEYKKQYAHAKNHLDVHVVHFHHRQRPHEADEDCQFVQDVVNEYNNCQDNLIQSFHVEDWNHVVDDTTLTFSQDKARQWRRTRLFEYTNQQMQSESKNITLGIILTAHHQDDSQESALLKLLRGVHLLNLQGMEAVTCLANHTTNNAIYLLRPFLQHPKQDLIDYLLARNLTWREDASNADNKYLRNRIRNELIPLLQDMTDCAFLDRRLPTMMQQSQLLWEDVEPRVQDFLKQQQQESQSIGCEVLWTIHHDDRHVSQLIYSQALHRWMTSRLQVLQSKDPGRDNQEVFQISYSALERVMTQLEQHSANTQWKLELGSHINVVRQGNVLRIRRDDGQQEQPQGTNKADTFTPWHWAEIGNASPSPEGTVLISIPRTMLSNNSSKGLAFFSTTLGELTKRMEDEGAVSLRFIPPWKTSPIKIRQFLRGQGVPSHQRDDVNILIGATQTGDRMKLFVVAVDMGEGWLVQRNFCHSEEKDNNDENSLDVIIQLTKIEDGIAS
jgi:tRNA(Ile)-lysidine synthetase-like protein